MHKRTYLNVLQVGSENWHHELIGAAVRCQQGMDMVSRQAAKASKVRTGRSA